MRGLQIGEGFRDHKSRQEGLQIGAVLGVSNRVKEITNWGRGFQVGAKRFQIREEITNRGKGDSKLGQGLQIGAGITNRCSTTLSKFEN